MEIARLKMCGELKLAGIYFDPNTRFAKLCEGILLLIFHQIKLYHILINYKVLEHRPHGYYHLSGTVAYIILYLFSFLSISLSTFLLRV